LYLNNKQHKFSLIFEKDTIQKQARPNGTDGL